MSIFTKDQDQAEREEAFAIIPEDEPTKILNHCWHHERLHYSIGMPSQFYICCFCGARQTLVLKKFGCGPYAPDDEWETLIDGPCLKR